MSIKRNIALFLILILFKLNTKGQEGITATPGLASIITNDIDHFWEAYDLLKSQKSTADSLSTIKKVFIEHASEGLRLYMKAANCYEEKYLETVRTKNNDYMAVREKTKMVKDERQIIFRYLKRFKQLYPSLKIPVICHAIGIFQVGGTQFENILFIGCETDAIENVDIPVQTIHEISHFQQKDQNPINNLELAMIEGGAEFVTYQVTGKRTLTGTWTYGRANESELWKEFELIKDSTINSKWFLNITDTVNKKPGSLGYFIGFRICEFYLKSHNKTALTDLIEMENPKKIFQGSHYKPAKN